ncbi:MAG: PAS domain-containing protein, partial [Beijerinckiaceae bacterium]|nr:PAS domain-containing protein [Beijerinckiaceae bacterium]
MSERTAYAGPRGIGRNGNLALAATFAMLLAAGALAFSFVSEEQGAALALAVVTFFAMAGLCASVAFAAGLCQFSGPMAKNDVTKLICDESSDGLIVTGAGGRIIYANDAYVTLTGARRNADVCTVERLFSGSPESAEASYRLVQAEREAECSTEEIRICPPLGAANEAGWYRLEVKPLPLGGPKRASLWSVADITRDRERQENVFQELRHAIDFLDHAPAGFFSCGQSGEISYINTTLADWLGYESAESGARNLKLTDITTSDVAMRIVSQTGLAGEVRTKQFDVELKCRDGQTLPARLLHRVTFGHDGSAGASHTLALKRASGEDAAKSLGDGVDRFARVFDAMPMAIVIVDKNGHIVRGNATFARLMPQAMQLTAASTRSIYSEIQDRDHAAVDASLTAAYRSALNIPP